MMKVAVIGGGRVGLPVAAGLASVGHRVLCCERDKAKRETAAAGKAPFVDEGLDDALASVVASGHLRFCADIAEAVGDARVVFMAVPVSADENGLHILQTTVAETAAAAPLGSVIAIKSTVPPGTCGQLQGELGSRLLVASNPEFLRQGFGLREFLNPSRIVVGTDNAQAAKTLRQLYAPIIKNGAEYIATTCINAEIAKLAANMFLSSRVALINELSDLCEATGACIHETIKVLATDRRIGKRYLHPSVGFGGGCLPKDGKLLLQKADALNVNMPAASAIYNSNRARAEQLAARILAQMPPRPTAAAWGVAYKQNSDDTRESAAIAVIHALCARGATVRACDAHITDVPASLPDNCRFFNDCFEALNGADMLINLVHHKEYAEISPAEIRRRMKGVHVFDCTGIFDCPKMQEAGLVMNVIGRKWGV